MIPDHIRSQIAASPLKIDAIVEAFGVSRSTVKNIRRAAGLSARPGQSRLDLRDQERIRSLYAGGMLRTHIAREYGHHHHTIRLVLEL
jgi:DNA invertase Pin-like site-specific DNA recombinase